MPARLPLRKRPVVKNPVRKGPPIHRSTSKALAAPYIAVILDETGSMIDVKDATISSYNEYIRSLQQDKNNAGARFALTRFNTSRTVTDGPADLAQVPPLTAALYQPDAMTDLYDAIGKTITRLDSEAPNGPVIVVILTDGLENSSREYTRDGIKALVTAREATKRWTFIYLGANQDAWAVGHGFGIQRGNAMTYQGDVLGTKRAMAAVATVTSSTTGAYRRSGGSVMASANAFSDAGIDRCLACGTKLVLGQPHICGQR